MQKLKKMENMGKDLKKSKLQLGTVYINTIKQAMKKDIFDKEKVEEYLKKLAAASQVVK